MSTVLLDVRVSGCISVVAAAYLYSVVNDVEFSSLTQLTIRVSDRQYRNYNSQREQQPCTQKNKTMNATTLIMQILSIATPNTPHAVNKTAINTVSACLLIMNYFNTH